MAMSPEPNLASVAAVRRAREAHHAAELRDPKTLAQASLLFVALSALPLIPGAVHVLGTPLRFTAVYGVVMVAAMWITFVVFRLAGVESRAYRVADTLETFTFANGPAVLVGLGPNVASVWWLPYFALCVYQASACGRRVSDGVVLGIAPAAAAFVFALRAHSAVDVAGAIGVGWLALTTWYIAAGATDRTLADQVERENLRARIVELERAREKAVAGEERRRIAMELHDGVGATLTSARLIAQLARRQRGTDDDDAFDALEATLKDGLADLRLALWSLDPEETSWPSVLGRLRRHCGDVCAAASLTLAFDVEGDTTGTPSPATTLAFVRVVQEALTNAVRHARATRIEIHVVLREGGVEVAFADDGVGASEVSAGEGRGLANIQRRVQALGGTATIAAAPDKGTRVVARLPAASAAVPDRVADAVAPAAVVLARE